jgi:hypothetical protein
MRNLLEDKNKKNFNLHKYTFFNFKNKKKQTSNPCPITRKVARAEVARTKSLETRYHVLKLGVMLYGALADVEQAHSGNTIAPATVSVLIHI